MPGRLGRGAAAAAFVAAAFCCGCAENLKPELKDIRPLPKFFIQQMLTRRKAEGLDIKIYDTGSVTVPGETLSELKSPYSRVKLSLPAFVVRHPVQGLIVFDAGLPPAVPGRKKRPAGEFGAPFDSRPGQELAAQLVRDGARLQDVRWIILSHLHWDHVGELDAFPNATVVVDRREWAAQKRKTVKGAAAEEFDPAAMEPRIRLRLVDLSSAPPYGMFDHGEDIFADGSVILIDLAGHTPGSLGLWCNLDSGPVLLAADAAAILDNCQDLALPARTAMADPHEYWRKINIMNQMMKEVPQLVIFPGHDLMPLKLKPRADIRLVAP